MPDPRHQKLAQVLVSYSLGIKPGDKLVIEGSYVAAPLVREVYREAIRAGAHIKTRIGVDGLGEIYFREASDEQLKYISELDRFEIDYYDAALSIWADVNTKGLSGVDPARMALASGAHVSLQKRYLERIGKGELSWCGTQFPTHANAQDAGMSLSDYEDFVFGAGMLDQADPVAAWRKVHDTQQHIADFLDQHNEIHIVAPDTDITYRVAGRKWINCAGTENFPDGEVFTGPIENSVNGTVRFSYPAVYGGREVEDVRLTFEAGKVVKASALRGQEFLDAMLDTDAGSRFLGEVAFGLNYNIQRFSRNMLFDEKIGGTMHMALGASLPESGGQNESGIHWDMVCDLHAGKVFADGQLIYENGKFVV